MNFRAFAIPIYSVFLFSCNNSNNNSSTLNGPIQKVGSLYKYVYDYVEYNDSVTKVEFHISSTIIDSLKIPDSSIVNMCTTAASYADFYVKHKPTFKINDFAQIYYIQDKNIFTCAIRGTAENSFGVPDELSTYIDFGRDFQLLKDSSGLPSITSF
jgi:hypothetical protein